MAFRQGFSLPLFYVGYQPHGENREISHKPEKASTLFEGSDHWLVMEKL
ncbi:Cyclopropane-fatty-acyl-phospholipid synthase [Enterobacter sp. FY-07]|nr:Cyclopropane-fatty-acyl-phospholipid synthase [Enterobacter sp. FY-07]